MNFYKEAYKWLGEGIKSFITNLKRAQIDELDKVYNESSKEKPKPLRGVAEADEKKGNSISEEDNIDPYEIADPVEIF